MWGNQGNIATATAEATAAERRLAFVTLTIRQEVTAVFSRYEAAQRALDIYTQGVRELARQNLAVVRKAYELGRTSLLDLIAEQRRYIDIGTGYTEVLKQVYSEVVVPSPIGGIVTARSANPGQAVSMSQELLVITDLSQVWAIADLCEQDLQAVREGSEATITTPAYPGLTLRGRVSYIDARVDPQTRTAKARVEVLNREARLQLGMYVTMAFTTPSGSRLVAVPRSAIQVMGDRHVVFLPVADEAGKFVACPVQIGPLHGEFATILNGL